MMNFQAFSVELADIMKHYEFVGVDADSKLPRPCDHLSCRNCSFGFGEHSAEKDCASALVDWMFKESKDEVS